MVDVLFVVKNSALFDSLLLFTPIGSTVTLLKDALYIPKLYLSGFFLFMILGSKHDALFPKLSQPHV